LEAEAHVGHTGGGHDLEVLIFDGRRHGNSRHGQKGGVKEHGKGMRLTIQIISTGASGKTLNPESSLKARPTNSVPACAMYSASTCSTNFWMLSKIRRPSSMAATMEAKLSSVSTMSETSLATSEPDWPMAMPTSAPRREGESFTPSPVCVC